MINTVVVDTPLIDLQANLCRFRLKISERYKKHRKIINQLISSLSDGIDPISISNLNSFIYRFRKYFTKPPVLF
jgi:hypothetical protein